MKAIIEKKPIHLFNNGNMIRDFTYIDDIVRGIYKVFMKPAKPDKEFDFQNPSSSTSPCKYKIFNIGNGNPIPLMKYVEAIELALNKKAIIDFLPMQPGDVQMTYANSDNLYDWIQYRPSTSINEGINNFINWYIKYFGSKK